MTAGRHGAPVPHGGARDAIVRAAIECFYEDGYETTSVQAVVERAGLTKGAFYHHFARKDDLLLHIHDLFMDEQLAALDVIIAEAPSPRQALTAVIEEMVEGAARFKREYTIFFEQRRYLSEDRFAQVRTKRDAYEQRVVAVIEQGIARGGGHLLPQRTRTGRDQPAKPVVDYWHMTRRPHLDDFRVEPATSAVG